MTPEQIERLKTAVAAAWRTSWSEELCGDLSALLAEWEERGREVERLSEQLRLCTVPDGWETWRRNAEAEIDRLKASLLDVPDSWAQERAELKAKVERLRDEVRYEQERNANNVLAYSQELTGVEEKLRRRAEWAEARLAKVAEILSDPMRQPVRRVEDALAAAQPKEEQ